MKCVSCPRSTFLMLLSVLEFELESEFEFKIHWNWKWNRRSGNMESVHKIAALNWFQRCCVTDSPDTIRNHQPNTSPRHRINLYGSNNCIKSIYANCEKFNEFVSSSHDATLTATQQTFGEDVIFTLDIIPEIAGTWNPFIIILRSLFPNHYSSWAISSP